MTKVEKSADPAASPSRPSIKLKALVIHTTQRIVSGSPTNHPKWGWPARRDPRDIPKPLQNKSTAAPAWATNFTYGPNPRKSSISPTMKMIAAGSRILKVGAGKADSSAPKCVAIEAKIAMHQRVRKMATPPRRGIRRVWMCRSEVGREFHPWAFEKSRTQRVRPADAKRAATNTMGCITKVQSLTVRYVCDEPTA